jgi:hypothetical protein
MLKGELERRFLKMGLSEDLNEAAQYTGSIFQRVGELLILLIISIIPIVDFIALGYYARIVRDSPSSRSVPRLEGYVDMFVEGLKIIVVAIIWAIIIGIISLIFAIPFIALSAINFLANPGVFLGFGWIFAFGSYFVIFGIIAFLLGIFAFMGIIHMVKTNDFGKAFAFGELFRMIGKIGWLRYIAFFVVFFIASAVVGTITGVLGPLGWIVGALLSVLVGLFFSRTIGLLYDDAAGVGRQPSVATQTQSV